MARRKNVDTEAPEEAQSPQDAVQTHTEDVQSDALPAEVALWAAPGTMGPNGYVPTPQLVAVPCEVYEGVPLVAYFNPDVAYRVVADGIDPPGATPLERACRRAAAMVPRWEGWAFQDPLTGEAIPAPVASDPLTYATICGARGVMNRLFPWIHGEGWLKAIDTHLGNSRRG
jgi:hypothetical protein